MSNSYPRRDQATGIWKINQITKNIKDQGTFPQGGPNLGLSAGGQTPSDVTTINQVSIKTTGNSTDFGDLAYTPGGNCVSVHGSHIRGLFAGGDGVDNNINYNMFASQGNSSDFGNLSVARMSIGGGSNSTRAIFMAGSTPSAGNVIDYVTIATLGNATDFGDCTQSLRQTAGNCNPTRVFVVGGDIGPSPAVGTNRIEFVETSTLGNGVDFGDTTNTYTWSCAQGGGSFTRALNGGGQDPSGYLSTIMTYDYSSLGNAVDYGDLSVARRLMAAFSDTQRCVWAGGLTPSGASNVIDYIEVDSAGTATDFGDLSATIEENQSGASNHQGLEEFYPRTPELYSPTGKIDNGNIGYICGGNQPSVTNRIQFIQINSLGNALDFGDLTLARSSASSTGNYTRGINAGGYTPTYFDTIDYLNPIEKGNCADFGNLSNSRYGASSASNDTIAVFMGGDSPVNDVTMDNVTIATLGNGTDFGDTVADLLEGGNNVNSSTRGVYFAGAPTQDTIGYITFSSLGAASDFGNITVNRFDQGGVSSTVRGISAGGKTPSASDVIDYITIASTGDATDFGNLSVTRAPGPNGSGNKTRGVFCGGLDPSLSNVCDYITIASTGNANDFGDLMSVASYASGASNGHGGLS